MGPGNCDEAPKETLRSSRIRRAERRSPGSLDGACPDVSRIKNSPSTLPCSRSPLARATACSHRVNPSGARVAMVAELSTTIVMRGMSPPVQENSGRPIAAAADRAMANAIISEIHHRRRSRNVLRRFSLSRRFHKSLEGTTIRRGGGFNQYRTPTPTAVAPRSSPTASGPMARKVTRGTCPAGTPEG